MFKVCCQPKRNYLCMLLFNRYTKHKKGNRNKQEIKSLVRKTEGCEVAAEIAEWTRGKFWNCISTTGKGSFCIENPPKPPQSEMFHIQKKTLLRRKQDPLIDDKEFLDRRPRDCYKVFKGFFAPCSWQKKILERCHWLISFYYTCSNKNRKDFCELWKRVGEALDKSNGVPEVWKVANAVKLLIYHSPGKGAPGDCTLQALKSAAGKCSQWSSWGKNENWVGVWRKERDTLGDSYESHCKALEQTKVL